MQAHPPLLLVATLLLMGCSKSGPGTAAEGQIAPAQPRRNTAESLGIVSGDPDSYYQNSPPAPGAAKPAGLTPIRRVLTGTDGRTLDAVLLSKTDMTVKIRRLADATEFVIPLDKLSAADRAFIKESGVPVTSAR